MENKVLKRPNQKTLASFCLAPRPRTLPRDGQKQQTETDWSSKAPQLICGIVNWGRGCLGGRSFCHIGGTLADVIKDIWQLGPTPSILGPWMRLWTYLKPKGLLFSFGQTYDFIHVGKSQHGPSLHHPDSTPRPCSGFEGGIWTRVFPDIKASASSLFTGLGCFPLRHYGPIINFC